MLSEGGHSVQVFFFAFLMISTCSNALGADIALTLFRNEKTPLRSTLGESERTWVIAFLTKYATLLVAVNIRFVAEVNINEKLSSLICSTK